MLDAGPRAGHAESEPDGREAFCPSRVRVNQAG
jgi:hypothetical protein